MFAVLVSVVQQIPCLILPGQTSLVSFDTTLNKKFFISMIWFVLMHSCLWNKLEMLYDGNIDILIVLAAAFSLAEDTVESHVFGRRFHVVDTTIDFQVPHLFQASAESPEFPVLAPKLT